MQRLGAVIVFRGLLLVVFLIPIHQGASAALLGILFLGSFIVGGRIPMSRYLAQAWDVWLYLLILLVGMLYTEDTDTGLKVLETSLSLFAFPFIFVKVGPFEKDKLYAVFYAFGAGLLAAFLFCLMHAGITYEATTEAGSFYADQLTAALDNTLPVYFAYYLIAMITFGLYLLYYQDGSIRSGVNIFLLAFFFVMLLLMGSSTAIVGVLFSLLYFVLKFMYEEKRRNSHRLAFGISLVFLICLFAINSLNVFGEANPGQDDYWERFVLWESAIEAMPNWLVGVGTGDYTAVLNTYYRSHDLASFAVSNFNPHNQFIETLFSLGIPGLVAVLLMIGRPIYKAVSTQNIIGFLTFFPFLIYGMTEVFFGRFQGVVFFAVFHQAFASFYVFQDSSLSLKEDKF